MADEEIEYIDGNTGQAISQSNLNNYDLSGSQNDGMDFDALEFIDGNTGKPIASDQIDKYDLDTATDFPAPAPQVEAPQGPEPGWWATLGNAIGTGAANTIGGLGSTIDALPGFDIGMGQSIKDYALPYQQGGEQFKNNIPKDSWKKTFANVSEGVAGMAPILPFAAASVPGMIGAFGVDTFGKTTNQTERRLQQERPDLSPEEIKQISESTGAFDTLGQMPLNAIGAGAIFNKARPFVSKAAVAGLVNAGLAIPGAASSMYAQYLGGARPDEPTLGEIEKAIPEAMLESGLIGSMLSATHSGSEAIKDYSSHQAMKRAATEARAGIDALESSKPVVTPEDPGHIETGDIIVDGKTRDFAPQETGRQQQEFTPQETGRAPEEFTRPDYVPPEFVPASTDPNVVKQQTAVPDVQAEMEASPIRQVPLKDLQLSKDVPQFKSDADANGIVEPLTGTYNEIGATPIIAWERLDGTMEVGSGRHRFDLANRTPGKKEILSHVLKEADGWTAENIAALDAELNIQDEKGTVQDFARYFKAANLSEQEATQRSLLSRVKGQEGYSIATKASPDVYDLFQNGKLNSKQAVAIAEAAPGNDTSQRLGAKLALAGADTTQIKNAIEDIQTAYDGPVTVEQVDMFGNNDSAINQSVEKTKIASGKVAELSQRINTVQNAAKKPEIAKELGVDVKDPNATKNMIEELKVERDKWQNWRNYPELRKELNLATSPVKTNSNPVVAKEQMLNFEPPPEADLELRDSTLDNSSDVFPEGIQKFNEPPKKPEVKKESTTIKETTPESAISKPTTITKRLKSEKGAVNLDIPNPFNTDGFKDFLSRMKGEGFKGNPDYYTFFSNKAGNALASQITKADRFPWYRKTHESSVKHFENENSLAWDHEQSLRPFTLLNAKEKLRVSGLMYEATRRGAKFEMSAPVLKKLKYTDREIRGVQAVQKTMDNALEMLREETKLTLEKSDLPDEAKKEKLANLEKAFNAMKVSNFVPTGRYGKYGLTLKNLDGTITDFIMSDSKVKLLKTLYAERRNNPDLDKDASIVSPVAKPLGSEYVGIHPDIVSVLGDNKAHIPSVNFLNRLSKRKLIEGFDEDLGRNLASYLASHTTYVSTQKLKREYAQHNKDFDAFLLGEGKKEIKLYSGLKADIKKLQDYMLTPSNNFAAMSKFFANFYLASNVKTSLVNLTSFATTYPNAARYISGKDSLKLAPEIAFAKATRDAGRSYIGKPKGELFAAMEQARKEGVIGGSRLMKDLLRDSSRPTPDKQRISAQDAIFLLNSATEDWVRRHSFAMGWHIYDKATPFFEKNNIPKPSQFEFAKRFVRETQGDYTKAGAPNFTQGKIGKAISTFRLYPHGFFTMLKKSVMEKRFDATARFLGVLGALGGVYAVPVVSTILKSAKGAGFDPDKKIGEATKAIGGVIDSVESQLPDLLNLGIGKYFQTPEGQRTAQYGLPTMANMNLSGAMDITNVNTGSGSGDPVGGIARAVGGVVFDPIDRLDKFMYFLNEKGNLGRALEQITPRAGGLSDMLGAWRINKEGLTDSSGHNILDGRKATPYELFLKSMSVMPATFQSAYDKGMKEKQIVAESDSKRPNYANIAYQFAHGSKEEAMRLINQSAENGAEFDTDALIKQMIRMESPEYNQMEKMGKKNMGKAIELNQEFKSLLEP